MRSLGDYPSKSLLIYFFSFEVDFLLQLSGPFWLGTWAPISANYIWMDSFRCIFFNKLYIIFRFQVSIRDNWPGKGHCKSGNEFLLTSLTREIGDFFYVKMVDTSNKSHRICPWNFSNLDGGGSHQAIIRAINSNLSLLSSSPFFFILIVGLDRILLVVFFVVLFVGTKFGGEDTLLCNGLICCIIFIFELFNEKAYCLLSLYKNLLWDWILVFPLFPSSILKLYEIERQVDLYLLLLSL